MAIEVLWNTGSKRIGFAVEKLRQALLDLAASSEGTVLIAHREEDAHGVAVSEAVRSEGFEFRRATLPGKQEPALCVLATDETGAMYGTLELAERLRNGSSFSEVEEGIVNPRFPFRAVKFNLPWSSYRKNECFELQMETVRDLEFWQGFLDMMAENRYNALTLWNLHPFPYMLRTASFPDATPLSDEQLAEWKSYWTKLFRMAKDRGIETYMLNWNIIVSEAFRTAYEENAVDDTMYHYGDSYDSERIRRYTRDSVTQMIDEYPDLTGFGLALGERMNDMTPEARQAWIEDVYYEGMKRASRPIKFIHRAPFSVDPSITRSSIEQNDCFIGPVWLEIKFNWSHAYSATELLLTHGGSNGMQGYWDPAPSNYKITWMVRNEDFFTLRWAKPDFIREHITRNGQDYVGGYYIGSECFIPGKDYSHIRPHPHMHWNYAYEKHWLYYMLWGRLLYEPSTPDGIFTKEMNRRLGTEAGETLLRAYALACGMPMALGSFYKFTWDFTLYAEGFLSTGEEEYNGGKAFISLEDLLESQPFDPSYLSIREFVARKRNGQSTEGRITPLQLAERLERDASQALELVGELPSDLPGLQCEIADIQAWCYLGMYFAYKLRAGVSYEIYRVTGDEGERVKAIHYLQSEGAAGHWRALVEVTKSHYTEQPLMHLGKTPFHWELFLPQVDEDIAFVKK
ncbi:hypothetical protein [Paenibacillus sp.]|uniref:hypothetical protein n=1 Tax=Paenibacillus sp. TaxID=58172 RepID=UPI002D355F04|nr:hypothetical protein [Paenibacillus sp.]HZG86698.1 hypothetical protein [Paenibacillus sp.]